MWWRSAATKGESERLLSQREQSKSTYSFEWHRKDKNNGGGTNQNTLFIIQVTLKVLIQDQYSLLPTQLIPLPKPNNSCLR